jgi:hypothetical protein
MPFVPQRLSITRPEDVVQQTYKMLRATRQRVVASDEHAECIGVTVRTFEQFAVAGLVHSICHRDGLAMRKRAAGVRSAQEI